MSILTSRAKSVNDMPTDGVYVIYGNNGTGKTVLASTFPKTSDKHMLYLDFLEGGTGSISLSERNFIDVIDINSFADLDEILTDVLNGYTTDDTGKTIPVSYSTIVFDSATQMEYLMKEYFMKENNKTKMNLNLWGETKQTEDQIYNLAKKINKVTGATIVIICHQKELQDEENPGNNKIIPSIMNSAAYSLCAKASFVWYTKVESETVVGADGKMQDVTSFYTYIDANQAYLTKTRKPKEIAIPARVKDLTYSKFKKNILDKI